MKRSSSESDEQASKRAERHYKTDREARNKWTLYGFDFDPSCKSNAVKISPGEYSTEDSKIELKEDGTTVINNEAYVDVILAWLYSSLQNNPNISNEIKNTWKKLIELHERRNWKENGGHGYSQSPAERDYTWIPTVDDE